MSTVKQAYFPITFKQYNVSNLIKHYCFQKISVFTSIKCHHRCFFRKLTLLKCFHYRKGKTNKENIPKFIIVRHG